MRLPRVRPYLPKESDPPIFWFNQERDDIIGEVTRRVVARHSETGRQLEFALNEIAFHEHERLSQQHDAEAAQRRGFFAGLLRGLSRMDQGTKQQTLYDLVQGMAADVAGNFDPRVYAFSEKVIPHLLTGVMQPKAISTERLKAKARLDALIGTDGHVEKLRKLSNMGTLVFVPTHSSNLDSIVLGYALSREGLPPVVYGAGKNLFTNPLISFFMHNLGAYRVDRRIRSAVYKDVLKTYSCVMLERGYSSLFFPGGTRSRSGAIESKLKLGLAGTAIEAFAHNHARGRGKPVWFVPTTINYALVLEAETLIEDHLKEHGRARYIIEDDEFSRFDRWVDFIRKLVDMRAACVLRFGDPIDPFGNPVNDEGQSLAPNGKIIDPASYVSRGGVPCVDHMRDQAYTRELAEVIVTRFRKETVLMATNLVAHVLYRRLVRSTPGIDVFGRIRHRGDVSMRRGELIQEVGEARDRLLELEAEGEVHVSSFMTQATPEEIVDRALRVWDGYHSRRAALDLGGEVSIEDPTLLLYYQNRLLPFAERIADASNRGAARDIAGGTPLKPGEAS